MLVYRCQSHGEGAHVPRASEIDGGPLAQCCPIPTRRACVVAARPQGHKWARLIVSGEFDPGDDPCKKNSSQLMSSPAFSS
jgi:hypothetical protein